MCYIIQSEAAAGSVAATPPAAPPPAAPPPAQHTSKEGEHKVSTISHNHSKQIVQQRRRPGPFAATGGAPTRLAVTLKSRRRLISADSDPGRVMKERDGPASVSFKEKLQSEGRTSCFKNYFHFQRRPRLTYDCSETSESAPPPPPRIIVHPFFLLLTPL